LQLYNAGYTDIQNIASAEAQDMSEKIKYLPFSVANAIIKSANRIMIEKSEF